MTFTATLTRSAIAASLLCCALTARSAITVYTSETAFQAAISEPARDSFDNLSIEADADSMAFKIGLYGYTARSDGGLYRAGSADDGWLSTNIALPIVFADFSGGVQAVGGYFFATDLLGAYLGGESVDVAVSDGSGWLTRTQVDPATTSFLGFVSTGAISGLRVAVLDTGSNNAWATADNLTLGQLATPVPEPQTGVLLLGGLAGLGLASRRRGAVSLLPPRGRPSIQAP